MTHSCHNKLTEWHGRRIVGLWREKLVERVKHGTVRMYGELEGIMGSAIPTLPALEAPYALG